MLEIRNVYWALTNVGIAIRFMGKVLRKMRTH